MSISTWYPQQIILYLKKHLIEKPIKKLFKLINFRTTPGLTFTPTQMPSRQTTRVDPQGRLESSSGYYGTNLSTSCIGTCV